MQTFRFSNRRKLTKAVVALLASITLAACSDDDDPATTPFVVNLSPLQSVPAVAVNQADGQASLNIDTLGGSINGSVTVTDLSGQATMVHIHSGFAGETGGVVIGLEGNSDGTVWSVPASTVLDAASLESLNAGGLYINVHTAANPAGEIRGQILPRNISLFRTGLAGEQEVPPVTTTATATAYLTLNQTSGAVRAVINASGADDATAAHVHQAARGSNGGVLFGLEQDATNLGVWRSPAGQTLDAAGRTALSEGGLYYNLHTPANPGGELRGQIGSAQFSVNIENVSDNGTLNTSLGTVAVPLSPGAYLIHRQGFSPLLEPRNPASTALEQVAEDGDPSNFPTIVPGSVIFNTPVGAGAPGPLTSGASYRFTVDASPGDKLSFVTMFVQSNDWFYTPTDEDDSISLFTDSGLPFSGDASAQVALWESGTEVDEEPGVGVNQAPRQSGPDVGTPEAGTVGGLAGRGKSADLNGSVIRVTVTPLQ
ncbi:MAG: CHRD domain-containing protein [Pseudomonadota bacterium]